MYIVIRVTIRDIDSYTEVDRLCLNNEPMSVFRYLLDKCVEYMPIVVSNFNVLGVC